MARWLKWVIGIILFPIALMLLSIFLVYLPPIQKYAKNKASATASQTLGMDVSIDRVALRFPFSLVVKDAYIIDAPDTVMFVKSLSMRIPFSPLFSYQIAVDGIELTDAKVKSKHLVPGYYVEGNINKLSLVSRGVDLNDSKVTVNRLLLKDTNIDLCITAPEEEEDTTSSEPFNWIIEVKNIDIENVSFNLSMPMDTLSMISSLKKASIVDCVADLGAARYSLGHFKIEDGKFGMNTGGTVTPGVFNSSDFMAEHINIELDSLAYAADTLHGKITRLALNEKSGLSIVSGHGSISSDKNCIYVNDLGIKTPLSELSMDIVAGWGLLDSIPNGAIGIGINLKAGIGDIEHLTGKFHEAIPRHPIGMSLGIEGTLDCLKLNKLHVAWENVMELNCEGEVSSLLDNDKLSASMNLGMKTGDLDFIKPATGMPDSSFFIPKGLTLSANAVYDKGNCQASLGMEEAGLTLEGTYSANDESYAVTLGIDSLVASDFINLESLSPVCISLRAEGKGFDPFDRQTKLRLRTRISNLKYGNYDLSNTVVTASLHHSRGRVDITTGNPWLDMATSIRANLSREKASLSLGIGLDKLDLTEAMGNDSCNICSLDAKFALSTDMEEMYDASGGVTNITFNIDGNEVKPKDLNFTAYTDSKTSKASISAGDLTMEARGDNNAMQIASMLQTFMEKMAEQLTNHELDYSKLKHYLPDLYFELRADNDNPVSNLMKTNGIDIGRTRVRISTNPVRGLAGDLSFKTIAVDSIKLDSAYMWFVQDSTSIRYKLNVANSQTMAEFVTGASVNGEITNRSADILIDMFDKDGVKGVYLGCKAEFVKEGLKMSFFPQKPVFLFRDFNLNENNYVLLDKDKNVYADVAFKDEKGLGLSLVNSTTDRGNSRLTASLSGIDLAEIRSLVPMLPDISGVISADLSYTALKRTYALSCKTNIDGFAYQGRNVADFSLELGYVPFDDTKQIMSAKLGINGSEALAIGGKYESGTDSIAYRMKVTELPLSIANPFLPRGFMRLDGSISGEMTAAGSLIKPLLNGSMTFNEASVLIVQAGTKVRFDDNPIVIDDSCIKFDKFALMTRTDNPFNINGTVDFSNLAEIRTNLQFMASNYELLNSSKTRASLVYGKAYIDMAITANGKLNDLKIRGYTKLLGNTNVTYVMKESSLTVQDRLGETITFTNFSDTTAVDEETTEQIPITGIDMLLSVSIDPTASVNIDLSDSGDNRIEVVGGGDLSMQYTAQGDLSLTGRYTFTGGKISYSFPLVKIADFTVKNGGYIDWTGNATNPSMNLTAVKNVRTDVAYNSGDGTRKVDFEVSVNIYNTLSDLGLSFDLDAPQDAEVQNTLAAAGEDERRTMALTMMITGIYIGTGSTADANFNMGSALNSLLQSEISNATNKIKAVDLSIGMENPNSDEGLQNMDISYKISKRFFNDRFSIVVGGTISTGSSNSTESDEESFIDNISLEYRLDNSGTRYVKLFHNKNYESVLEGEITETGGGIVLRKKMLRLGELFIFKRKKQKKNAET